MATIYLVRHGDAAAHWTDAADPGLSLLGRTQAEEVARVLAPRGPLEIVSSPLRRARETAEPLEAMWRIAARVDSAIGEIASKGIPLAERSAWLTELMQDSWNAVDQRLQKWRLEVLDFMASLESDAVIFSHFVAINVIVGNALGRDEVLLFKPANASVTVIENTGGRLCLIEQGACAEAIVC